MNYFPILIIDLLHRMIKDLFEFTRTSKQKCLVFIDEIDSICRKRNDREGDHSRRYFFNIK